ncbi:salivary glue protein Sgs-4 isoform X1 [Drosophila miranda]|uniref:salivary glue protein Sgs-4 isoform X1 n=1 Tax=Drosophila miranda TaxID=7229 RepID=UPI00143F3198|nr:salivary glue protein Sgs-4 isoform X1 [Drosophila miranda]
MRFLWLMGLIVAGALFEASASKCSKRRPRTCVAREPTNVDDNSDLSEDCDCSDGNEEEEPTRTTAEPTNQPPCGSGNGEEVPCGPTTQPPISDCQPTCSTLSHSEATSPGTTRTTAEPTTQPPCGSGNGEEVPCGPTTQPPISDCQPTCCTWSPPVTPLPDTSPGTTRTTAEPTTQPPCGCGETRARKHGRRKSCG